MAEWKLIPGTRIVSDQTLSVPLEDRVFHPMEIKHYILAANGLGSPDDTARAVAGLVKTDWVALQEGTGAKDTWYKHCVLEKAIRANFRELRAGQPLVYIQKSTSWPFFWFGKEPFAIERGTSTAQSKKLEEIIAQAEKATGLESPIRVLRDLVLDKYVQPGGPNSPAPVTNSGQRLRTEVKAANECGGFSVEAAQKYGFPLTRAVRDINGNWGCEADLAAYSRSRLSAARRRWLSDQPGYRYMMSNEADLDPVRKRRWGVLRGLVQGDLDPLREYTGTAPSRKYGATMESSWDCYMAGKKRCGKASKSRKRRGLRLRRKSMK